MEGIEAGAAYNHMAALQPRASTKSWSGDGYEIHRLDPHLYEDMLYEYELRVDRHTTITLPTCHSGLEVVETREPGGPWRRIETFRTARDFRVQFECDPGEYELRLQLPGLLF